MHIAAQRQNGVEAAGVAERMSDDVLNHFGRWFGPTLIFVCAHVLARGAVNNVVFAVQMGGIESADHYADGVHGSGWRVNGGLTRHRELVILVRASGAAAAE